MTCKIHPRDTPCRDVTLTYSITFRCDIHCSYEEKLKGSYLLYFISLRISRIIFERFSTHHSKVEWLAHACSLSSSWLLISERCKIYLISVQQAVLQFPDNPDSLFLLPTFLNLREQQGGASHFVCFLFSVWLSLRQLSVLLCSLLSRTQTQYSCTIAIFRSFFAPKLSFSWP